MKDILSILLPRFIREKLYISGENYDNISKDQGKLAVLFCDITNFDDIMLKEEENVIKILDILYRQFDKSCISNQVLKIETVGKTYMAAAGLKDVDEYQQDLKSLLDPVKRCIQLALEMQEIVKSTINDVKIEIKIGINYGTAIAGVIGFHKPQFSLIGDTINTASRMCSTAEKGKIVLSEQAYMRRQKEKAQQQFKEEKDDLNNHNVKKINLNLWNGKMKNEFEKSVLMDELVFEYWSTQIDERDCYVIIGNTDHQQREPIQEAINVLKMAFSMIDILSKNIVLIQNQINIRIGIHTGKIVGGLVGTQIIRYDIYGQDVLIANKMESNGVKGGVTVSESTKNLIEESMESCDFEFIDKGEVYIKSINKTVNTYLVDRV
ncbi:hypothetical protein IMG5_121780 [Ichthyophthirius multifiliis]|uniref:adenylate cyclase n=1 Tax=Ichthyophthirius multifiliis TaxID=5932 RepID=G0QV79_ICHMU|nr:hypothetical protein IMG5_121780 [Ichthyophthirius multifiliis]EGR30880.1 hypothetical protein IMG5_121780 [Ichthyophthirius multifiliis]|eukprot:XP_004032467.1 hypothetical protein IMG5_121780 [Ichthyophthirius multifiliis]